MYAIIEVKGKQYKIEKDSKIFVDYLGEDVKDAPEIKVLLLKKDDGSVVVGTPYIDDITVDCEVKEEVKGKKVIVFKYKKRKDYQKKQGHRQKYHLINIKDIKA